MTDTSYHYTECGLDYVRLASGFTSRDSPRGRQVSIKDIDGLHQAIGRFLITQVKDLSGKEIRFLRVEMGMSQATLAKLLDVSEQAIHRWEKGKTGHVPKPAEALIRLLYGEQIGNNHEVRSALKRIADIEDARDRAQLALTRTRKGWQPELKAA